MCNYCGRVNSRVPMLKFTSLLAECHPITATKKVKDFFFLTGLLSCEEKDVESLKIERIIVDKSHFVTLLG